MSLKIKKIILMLAIVCAAAFLSAQDQDAETSAAQTEQASNAQAEEQNDSEQELDLYYFNLPIVKIFNHPRGYYILYRTANLKIGKMYIPWEWMDFRDQRAIYNTVRTGIAPYISYVTNHGEFFQVRINASSNLTDSTWGVIGSGRIPDENFDIDSVSLQF